jgi:chemotaxis protein methyltransferase CheR
MAAKGAICSADPPGAVIDPLSEMRRPPPVSREIPSPGTPANEFKPTVNGAGRTVVQVEGAPWRSATPRTNAAVGLTGHRRASHQEHKESQDGMSGISPKRLPAVAPLESLPAAAAAGAARNPGKLSLLIARSLQDVAMEDDDFRFIVKVVHDRAGIALTSKKRAMVYARLSRRIRELGLTNFRDYRLRLEDGGNEEEMGALVNALTTNYTKFFREDHHFAHLTEEMIPALLRQSQATGRRRLRIWSAGCSSGEEAYSIAMTLRHNFPGLESWDARVLATDIDTNVLAHAESGLYPAKQISDIPEAYRGYARAIDQTNERFRVAGHVRSLVAFKPLNLIEPWPMKGKFDVIFCRNVIIYFDKRTQDQLIKRFTGLLTDNGLLYLGHSESPIPFEHRLKLVGRSIYRKLP